MTDTTAIVKLLGTDFGEALAKEFGIENDTKEAQAELLAAVGQHVFERVVFEILTALPKSAHPQFEALIGSQDFKALNALLHEHIADPDAFIAREAKKELQAVKARADELVGV